MSNCPITLKSCIAQRYSLNRRMPMWGEYGLDGQIRAIKGKYDQVIVSMAKCE